MGASRSKSTRSKISSTTESSTTAVESSGQGDVSFNPWYLPIPAEIIRLDPPKSLTPEWFQSRRGRLTASKRAGIIYDRKGTQWEKMADEIREEINPEWSHREFDVPAMQWGRDHEREALDAIERRLGSRLTEPGLILHPDFDYVGATPDGFTGTDITIQVKCPFNPKNHMKTVIDNQISREYYMQVQWESWVSGRPVIFFASYDPRQPRVTQLVIVDIPADLEMHDRFADNAVAFAKFFTTGIFPGTGKLSVESGIPDLF